MEFERAAEIRDRIFEIRGTDGFEPADRAPKKTGRKGKVRR